MPFTFERTDVDGTVLIKPRVWGDERGFFMEAFSSKDFQLAGLQMEIVQINHSRSVKGVLRGLHFQRPPFEQAKLVRCIGGEILDVVADIRAESATYGKHFSTSLSDSNRCLLYVPRGFAHGFLVLSDVGEVEYAVDNLYAPDYEGGVIWNDPELNIKWPVANPILSKKDATWPRLSQLNPR